MKHYKLIGLTGQSGAGKSTVAEVFAKLGAYVINADMIVAELYNAGSPCLKAVAAEFGQDILKPDGFWPLYSPLRFSVPLINRSSCAVWIVSVVGTTVKAK